MALRWLVALGLLTLCLSPATSDTASRTPSGSAAGFASDASTDRSDNKALLSARSSKRLAVVMPFVGRHVRSVVDNLKRWRDYMPCQRLLQPADVEVDGRPDLPSSYSDEVTLIFYMDGDKSPDFDGAIVQKTVLAAWKSISGAAKCFAGGVQFLSAALTPKESKDDSSCLMFYRLFGLLEPRFDHFFLMEPDVLPVQPFWVDKLVLESQQPSCVFWQKGSVARCEPGYADNQRRVDFHINGNSLYCLNDPAFTDYRRRVQAFYGPSRSIRHPGACVRVCACEECVCAVLCGSELSFFALICLLCCSSL